MSGSPAGRLYNLDSTFVSISGVAETVRVQGERLQAQLGNDGSLILTSTTKTSNRERRRVEARNVHQSMIERHALALTKLLETVESISRDIETGTCSPEVGGQQLTKLLVQKGKLARRIAELEATTTLPVAYSEVESGTTVTLLPGVVTATFLGLPVIWCPRPLLAAEQHEEIPVSGPIPVSDAKVENPVIASLPTPTVKSLKPPPSPMIFPASVESKSPFFAPLSTATTSLDLSAGSSSSSSSSSSTPSLLNGGFGTFDFNAPSSVRQSSTSSELKEEDGGDGEGADEGECTATFVPVVKLSETKIDSGEGDEDCIYQQMSLLYRFDPVEQAWKTRGKGYVKLMKHRVTQQVRLILREDKTLKVRMNHRVNPLVELKSNGEKAWTWATTDYAEDQAGSEQTFSIKFGTVELAKEFKAKHDEARSITQAGEKNASSSKPVSSTPVSITTASTTVSTTTSNTAFTSNTSVLAETKPPAPAAVPFQFGTSAVTANKPTQKQEEKCLYEEKCLMYCYDSVEKKWPAAKTGQAKLLQHRNGQVRIVVEEPTKSLCLNHLVNPSVELKPNAGSDKSWTWAAVDYAVNPEGSQHTFAIKFRTTEQSVLFKKKHDEAKSENARGEFETGAPLGDSEDSSTNAFGNMAFGNSSKDLGPITSAIFGSSFVTPTAAATTESTPFTGFGSFGTTTASSTFSFTGFGTSTSTTGFSFSTSAFSFAAPTATATATSVTTQQEPTDEYFGATEGGEDPNVEAECTATYVPVVKLEEKKVDSGESNENCTYQQMCLLYRFDNNEKAWKTRGKGLVKLLQHHTTNKFRIVLREDKTLKVRMNHSVNPLVELKPVSGSDKSWMWSTTDYAEEEPSAQTFSITFGTADLAKEFKAKHDEARLQNGGTAAPKPLAPAKSVVQEEPKTAPVASTPAQPPVKTPFQLLKDPTDWSCAACDVENKKDAVKCRSCETPNPNAPAPVPGTSTAASPFTFGTFTFGAPASGGAPGGPATGFSFSSTVPFTFGSSTASINFPSSVGDSGKQEDADEGDYEGDEGDIYDEGDFHGEDFGDEDGE